MANIILDYDGTVHDCAKIYVPAFLVGYKYLTDNGLVPIRQFREDEITCYLGYSVKDMWNTFMPNLSDEYKKTCGKIIGDEMKALTENGMSMLYDGAENMLKTLRKDGHTLIFLSNCTHEYMEIHKKAHSLDNLYDDFYCTEDFNFKSKPEIFTSIMEKYSGEFIVVGDRSLDIQIAVTHSLKSIGCLYGYGKVNELDNADVLVNSVNEIPMAVCNI